MNSGIKIYISIYIEERKKDCPPYMMTTFKRNVVKFFSPKSSTCMWGLDESMYIHIYTQ